MNSRDLFIGIITSLAVVACAGDSHDPSNTTHRLAITDGTPEALGVVNFLNAPTTTVELLDIDVALNVRTAERLIDNRPYRSFEQVDAVKGVGPVTLSKLEAWVVDNGWLPDPQDFLGVWDTVSFTVEEADNTLELVNKASQETLDVDLGLDARAVKSILKARPIEGMTELSELYYVGPVAMQTLKDAANPEAPLLAGDCRSNDDCEGTLSCRGIPFDGSTDLGRCIDLSPIPGEGAWCDADTPCAEGLGCAGVEAWGDGICNPLWMFGSFDNTTEVTIDDPGSATSEVVVYGLASVPVDIAVTLDISHPNPSDLTVILTDPNGTSGTVWSNEADPQSYVAVNNGISRDDAINGLWTLTVTDTVSGNAGTLHGWTLDLSSRWD